MKCKHKPCHNKVDGTSDFCSKACYYNHRYRTDKKFREKKKILSAKWQKDNPEKYATINHLANKKWRTNNPQKISDLVNAWQKRTRASRIKKGLCSNCGSKREDKKFLQCKHCREESRKLMRKKKTCQKY